MISLHGVTRHVPSEAPSASAGVAGDVAVIRLRSPGRAARGADDAREQITFRPPELAPWRVRIDFLVYFDADSPGEETQRARTYEYVPVGCELAAPISISVAKESPRAIRERYARVAAIFDGKKAAYQHQGELLLRHEHDRLADVRRAMMTGKAHKHHPLLVADYRARAGAPNRNAAMAEAYNVHRSTIFRELRAAVAAGHMSADELERR